MELLAADSCHYCFAACTCPAVSSYCFLQVTLRFEVLAGPQQDSRCNTGGSPYRIVTAALAAGAEGASPAGACLPLPAIEEQPADIPRANSHHQQQLCAHRAADATEGDHADTAALQACRKQQQQIPEQWLGIRRVLKGDTTTSLIKRPGSHRWLQVTQVGAQHA